MEARARTADGVADGVLPIQIRTQKQLKAAFSHATCREARRVTRQGSVLSPKIGKGCAQQALHDLGFDYNVKGKVYKDGWMRQDVQETLHNDWVPYTERVEKSRDIYDGPNCEFKYPPMLDPGAPQIIRNNLDQAVGRTNNCMHEWNERGAHNLTGKNDGALVHFSIIINEVWGRFGFCDASYARIIELVREKYPDSEVPKLVSERASSDRKVLIPQYADNIMKPGKGHWCVTNHLWLSKFTF
jgi:hypothetical protein